jgi:hypothetical protein
MEITMPLVHKLWSFIACLGTMVFAAQTIQVDVKALLNARPVTVTNAGKLVAWTQGLDGDYSGEATMAAGKLMGDALPKALPDDGKFAANDKHPEIILHFANEDVTGMQVRRSTTSDTFSFAVPVGKYSKMAIFSMSANGPSQLTVQLFYSDEIETRNLTVPDWYNLLPAGDADRYYVAYDLAKWSKDNKKTEPDHHYLYGLELKPDPSKTLTRIKVGKSPGGAHTFWGATGVSEGVTTISKNRNRTSFLTVPLEALPSKTYADGLGRSFGATKTTFMKAGSVTSLLVPLSIQKPRYRPLNW